MISVITPCYNLIKDGREEFFHKMMESIHNQIGVDIEHIVIDGGSTDGTLEILKSYQAKGWIDKMVSEKDSCVYEAMNKGIRIARGEYINIMNTDDYLLDNNFFVDSLTIISEKGVDFTHADRIIKSRKGDNDVIKKGDERVAFFRMPFRHQTMIVKKEAFDEIGVFDELYRIAADYKFVVKMLLAGKTGFHIDRVVLCSLGGGLSSDRQGCINEVSRVLFECYGEQYGLSMDDCTAIYMRKISLPLMLKIFIKIKDSRITKSLFYCFLQ